MKVKKILAITFALALIVGTLALTGCGNKDVSTGNWANDYKALLESGEARDYSGYDALKKTLDDIRTESGATYVYALNPDVNGKPSMDKDAGKNDFLITVDGSPDPDDWGEDYDWEIQFQEAWEGQTAAARSAWQDEEETWCWSAFAPVYDSNGDIVCLLGMDFPAEVIANFPEWDRDSDSWNGMEDAITVQTPAEIEALIKEATLQVEKYAKQLSNN